jgi:hypothetical protein
MGKEHANLTPTCKTGIYFVKIGFRILTTIFPKLPVDKSSLNEAAFVI